MRAGTKRRIEELIKAASENLKAGNTGAVAYNLGQIQAEVTKASGAERFFCPDCEEERDFTAGLDVSVLCSGCGGHFMLCACGDGLDHWSHTDCCYYIKSESAEAEHDEG